MIAKQHTYTEQEAYNKLSGLCASAEYCEADMRKKMSGWNIGRSTPTPSKGKGRSAQTLPNGENFEETEIDEDADENYSKEVKDRIIAKLFEEKFLDHRRYAHAFARDKFRYNHWGKVRITQELRMRKIDAAVIDDALTEIPDDDNLDALHQLIENKKRSVRGKSDYDVRCKLIRFALGRGFPMEDILKIVGPLDD